jgi:hypothetical protein
VQCAWCLLSDNAKAPAPESAQTNERERGIGGFDKKTIFVARRNFRTLTQLSKDCDERRVQAQRYCAELWRARGNV